MSVKKSYIMLVGKKSFFKSVRKCNFYNVVGNMPIGNMSIGNFVKYISYILNHYFQGPKTMHSPISIEFFKLCILVMHIDVQIPDILNPKSISKKANQ
jgi:hypothetical protein